MIETDDKLRWLLIYRIYYEEHNDSFTDETYYKEFETRSEMEHFIRKQSGMDRKICNFAIDSIYEAKNREDLVDYMEDLGAQSKAREVFNELSIEEKEHLKKLIELEERSKATNTLEKFHRRNVWY